MNRIIVSIIFTFATLVSYAQQDTTALPVDDIKEQISVGKSDNEAIQKGIEAYNEGDFYKAIECFEGEMKIQNENGLESPQLYYNLGNAYYRVNELGRSRLYYERALLLDPSDRDIQHNIEYITTKVEDKILLVDTIFIANWFKSVQNLFASDAWANAGVIGFLLIIACLGAFFFSIQILVKKTSFYVGLVLIIFVIFANIFAHKQKQKVEQRDSAIITAASVSIVSSPDLNSKELFRLHVGTKVSITKDDRNWLEIEIDNGSVGWIQRDKLEII